MAPGTLQQLEQVGRIDRPRPPKSEGFPEGPQPDSIRIHDNVVYTGYHTERSVTLIAFDATTNTVRWEQTAPTRGSDLSLVTYEVVDGALILEAEHTDRDSSTSILDPATGKTLWQTQERAGCKDVCHYGGRLITESYAEKQSKALDLRTGNTVWSVPLRSDEPPFTWIQQQTAESLTSRGKPQAHAQRYVGHGQKATGFTQIIETETGRIVGEGTLGDKVMDYVLLDDVLHVFRQTPRELAAYRVTDLATPLWTQKLPAAKDGSALIACDPATLCLTLLTGNQRQLRVIDAATGTTRWETDRYPSTHPHTGIRSVEGLLAISTDTATELVNPQTGEPARTVDSKDYSYTGQDILITHQGRHPAYDATTGTPVDLGPAFGTDVNPNHCVFSESLAACSDPDKKTWEITFWRYRT